MSPTSRIQVLISVVFLLVPAASSSPQDDQIQSKVEVALDSWTNRPSARKHILDINPNPLPTLIAIAGSQDQSFFRRQRAIGLLGTFRGETSEHALDQLADDPNPQFRCMALHSLVELNSDVGVPVLIRKLDDQDVCMWTSGSHMPEDLGVYVSDEAVRMLQEITGRRFEKESVWGHRKTKPWKKWWARQKKAVASPGH